MNRLDYYEPGLDPATVLSVLDALDNPAVLAALEAVLPVAGAEAGYCGDGCGTPVDPDGPGTPWMTGVTFHCPDCLAARHQTWRDDAEAKLRGDRPSLTVIDGDAEPGPTQAPPPLTLVPAGTGPDASTASGHAAPPGRKVAAPTPSCS